jgi:hypothetical protein
MDKNVRSQPAGSGAQAPTAQGQAQASSAGGPKKYDGKDGPMYDEKTNGHYGEHVCGSLNSAD